MRAILRCTTRMESEQLDALLSNLNWWPSLGQDHPIVKERANDIITHIADQDREMAKATLVFTVYDATTKTWGTVSNPAKHVLTFRLKNPVSERLKAAAEKLVRDLQPVALEQGKDRGAAFQFVPQVEVLEPNSQDRAFSGEILPPQRFWLAVQERKTAAIVGALSGVLAVVLLVLTSPPVKAVPLASLSVEWQQWISGNLERFTTAALVTLTISWFEVLIHWFDVRRKRCIRWTLE